MFVAVLNGFKLQREISLFCRVCVFIRKVVLYPLGNR